MLSGTITSLRSKKSSDPEAKNDITSNKEPKVLLGVDDQQVASSYDSATTVQVVVLSKILR